MGNLEEGQALLRAGRPREALHKFEAALDEEAPLEAMLGAARAAALLGHVSTAIEVLAKARELAPRDARLLRELFTLRLVEGQYAQAIEASRALAALEPDRGEPLYQEGVALLLSSDADGAQARFEAALAKEPTLWQAGQGLAKIERMRGKLAEAQARLEALVAAHPDQPALANDLAALYLSQPGQEARAEEVLRRVIAAHPDEPLTAYNLALALKTKNRAEAQRYAQIAAKAEASISDAARRLADSLEVSTLILTRMGRG